VAFAPVASTKLLLCIQIFYANIMWTMNLKLYQTVINDDVFFICKIKSVLSVEVSICERKLQILWLYHHNLADLCLGSFIFSDLSIWFYHDDLVTTAPS
jgi:hypothetical protein